MTCITRLTHVLFFVTIFTTWANAGANLTPDEYYQNFVQALIESDRADRIEYENQPGLICEKQFAACQSQNEIMLQALDEMALDSDNSIREKVAAFALAHRSRFHELGEQLQLFVVLFQTQTKAARSDEAAWWLDTLFSEFENALDQRQADTKTLHTVWAHSKIFSGPKWAKARRRLIKLYGDKIPLLTKPLSVTPASQLARDLIYNEADLKKYHNGELADRPRVYMFCRQDRSYPCLMIMKESSGALHRLANQTLWSQPSLGYSRHHKKFNQSNGNTPAGIFRIDGAMPDADRSLAFGKFRRLMINMIEKSDGEQLQKYLLPNSSQNETWWQEAVVARDMGRGLFRIHGTGVPSFPGTHFYPFVGTSGCVAKRENSYDGVNYVDQHLFLQELLIASGLPPRPENETKIRGLLYVINIDNLSGAVTLRDLERYGIK